MIWIRKVCAKNDKHTNKIKWEWTKKNLWNKSVAGKGDNYIAIAFMAIINKLKKKKMKNLF